MENTPLVSVIIRTCNRPYILRNALDSICRQTYADIEVVVVEDGPNEAEALIKEYAGLNAVYYAMGTRRGRTSAGNKGLELAQGKYINFLDDDDILLPRHIELLVACLEEKQARVAYSVAEEHQITRAGAEGKFKVRRKLIRYHYPFNRMLLFYMNYFPIQTVMFSRELYHELGGFDENLNELEDWDLWVRYATKYDFCYVDEVTSVYYTPYKDKAKRKRDIAMKEADARVRAKHDSYMTTLSVGQVSCDMDYILNVFNQKNYIFYMKKIRNWLLYRDR